jgi:hypothetical protein
MRRKIITISIVLSLLIIGYLSSAHPILIERIDLNRGKFEAEIGLGRNERPASNLEGNYYTSGRTRLVGGVFTSSEINGRFQGAFNRNTFFMKIPDQRGTLTIFGKIRVNDDYSSFIGAWHTRGFDIKGWISGEFIDRE